MQKVIILVICVLSVMAVSAQQDPQFSQNMFNKLANNPGFAGSRGVVATSVLHRSQYIGFGKDGGAGASTQNFSVDAELPFLYGGVGLNIVTDKIGEYSNLGLQASYAYRTELGVGQIGMGMSVGMFQSGLNGGFLNAATEGDPVIPTGDVKGSALDLGAGVYYNTQDVYIGISLAHLTEPTIEWADGQDYNMARHYFLIAGYTHDLNPMLLLHPSIYLKSGGATSQLDINTSLIYNNKMWGGVSYRLDELSDNNDEKFTLGIIALFGINITDDLYTSFSYDVVRPDLKNSLEVMLGYNFKVNYNKAISKYKNPRFL